MFLALRLVNQNVYDLDGAGPSLPLSSKGSNRSPWGLEKPLGAVLNEQHLAPAAFSVLAELWGGLQSTGAGGGVLAGRAWYLPNRRMEKKSIQNRPSSGAKMAWLTAAMWICSLSLVGA